jgi:DNA-binding beta-propeller fold protein YncE
MFGAGGLAVCPLHWRLIVVTSNVSNNLLVFNLRNYMRLIRAFGDNTVFHFWHEFYSGWMVFVNNTTVAVMLCIWWTCTQGLTWGTLSPPRTCVSGPRGIAATSSRATIVVTAWGGPGGPPWSVVSLISRQDNAWTIQRTIVGNFPRLRGLRFTHDNTQLVVACANTCAIVIDQQDDSTPHTTLASEFFNLSTSRRYPAPTLTRGR